MAAEDDDESQLAEGEDYVPSKSESTLWDEADDTVKDETEEENKDKDD